MGNSEQPESHPPVDDGDLNTGGDLPNQDESTPPIPGSEIPPPGQAPESFIGAEGDPTEVVYFMDHGPDVLPKYGPPIPLPEQPGDQSVPTASPGSETPPPGGAEPNPSGGTE